MDILAGGMSSIDSGPYLTPFQDKDSAERFFSSYGYDLKDPIQAAEIFGNYQESLQFIKKFFLKEGNEEDGLELTVPNLFYTITDLRDLLLVADGRGTNHTKEEVEWAGVILKVMNTILHLDKDLRHRYFPTIQTQIFDRFYRYIHRDGEELYLGVEDSDEKIYLNEFETKAKKTRESMIIKLLHKKENVAEELFDRIGVRFITKSKFDCYRVLNFLHKNHIVMVNNIKPSRTQNSLVNQEIFRSHYIDLLKDAIKNNLTEEDFQKKAEELMGYSAPIKVENDNQHTFTEYKAIHFTSRQLIKYHNPFYKNFKSIRDKIKEANVADEFLEELVNLDTSTIAREIRFFYPFEVQITDLESHLNNTDGEASHQEYKRSQVQFAQERLFGSLHNFND